MPERAATSPPTRGHKKKERTRRLLLETAVEVVGERGEAFSVSDIATRAGVSHGTFYNYFADRDALIEAVVADILDTFTVESARTTVEDDPALRFALITARALELIATAPALARVALRLEPIQRALVDRGPFGPLREDLDAGRTAGRFSAPDDDATLDVVIGSVLIAARRIVDGAGDEAYRRALIRRLLTSLGLPEAEADTISAEAVRTAHLPAGR